MVIGSRADTIRHMPLQPGDKLSPYEMLTHRCAQHWGGCGINRRGIKMTPPIALQNTLGALSTFQQIRHFSTSLSSIPRQKPLSISAINGVELVLVENLTGNQASAGFLGGAPMEVGAENDLRHGDHFP